MFELKICPIYLPPQGPTEYAAMVAGLCLKEAGGKWSSKLVRAGGSEQLYSGVTIWVET